MDALTLKDFKKVRDWAESDNIQKRIQAAKSMLATKRILMKLSNDKFWLVRLYVTMNKNITEDILIEMKKKESDLIVLNQINSELSFIEKIRQIRNEAVN